MYALILPLIADVVSMKRVGKWVTHRYCIRGGPAPVTVSTGEVFVSEIVRSIQTEAPWDSLNVFFFNM